MDKYIYDENNGLWYELQGDYYLSCLTIPAEKEDRYIGVWGRRHLRYLRQHRKVLYTDLMTSGRLHSYLADIDEQAEALFSRLVKQIAESENITEELKAENAMLWIGRMNIIQARAREIVYAEIVYA